MFSVGLGTGVLVGRGGIGEVMLGSSAGAVALTGAIAVSTPVVGGLQAVNTNIIKTRLQAFFMNN
jgi:hypothetical protein